MIDDEQITTGTVRREMVADLATKLKRIPSADEIMEHIGTSKHAAAGVRVAFTKTLPKLFILPTGGINSGQGDRVWVRLPSGSLSLAKYRVDPELGHIIEV